MQNLKLLLGKTTHYLKSFRIRSFSGPYFPIFGLNIYHKESKYGHFSRSDLVQTFDLNVASRKNTSLSLLYLGHLQTILTNH